VTGIFMNEILEDNAMHDGIPSWVGWLRQICNS